MKIDIFAVPKLKSAAMEVVEHLEEGGYDALFLPFSRSLEVYARELAEGAPYKYFIEELKRLKLISEPVGSWEYFSEPILRALSRIKRSSPDLEIYCYEDQLYERVSTETAVRASILALNTLITGKVNAEAWRQLLKDEINCGLEAIDKEVNFIADIAGSHKVNVCVSGFNGKYIAARFKREGHDVRLTYLHLPYFFTPLEVLKRELMQEKEVSDERVEKLVRQHVEYVREYILTSGNVDEAYCRWVYDKFRHSYEI
jgi:hypothetical protein